jgi:multicomponent Na+:H+ antiporter subunit D
VSGDLQILLAIGLPLLGALGIAAASRFPNLRETVTLATAVSLTTVVWSLLPAVMAGDRPVAALPAGVAGVPIAFSVEPLGMLFAALASLLWIVNSIYSIGYMRGNNESHQTRFYICFAVALSAATGIAFAGNLLTLFLFYEMLTLSTYPLVAHKGDAATVKQARVYLGILLGTSIGLLLPAMLWIYLATGTLDFIPGGIVAGHIGGPALGLLLALCVFGVGKAAVMPVHRWLPAAMVAPTPVSALLHAVAVVKAGVFTITKLIIYIFGVDYLFAEPSSGWLVYVAAFTVLAASVVALRQTNLKRLLAYSTIGQLSYVVMAAAVLQPLAEVGAAVHRPTHALDHGGFHHRRVEHGRGAAHGRFCFQVVHPGRCLSVRQPGGGGDDCFEHGTECCLLSAPGVSCLVSRRKCPAAAGPRRSALAHGAGIDHHSLFDPGLLCGQPARPGS